jgi:hypothetical protein
VEQGSLANDTTEVTVTYDCGTPGTGIAYQGNEWIIYPNPASLFVFLKFRNPPLNEQVQIYNADGRAVKIVPVTCYRVSVNNPDRMAMPYFTFRFRKIFR